MNNLKKNIEKIVIYSIVLLLSATIFTLTALVYQWPDGFWGFIIVLACIYGFIGSALKLISLTKDPAGTVANILDILFWFP